MISTWPREQETRTELECKAMEAEGGIEARRPCTSLSDSKGASALV